MQRPNITSAAIEVLPTPAIISLQDRAKRINEANDALGACLNQAGNWVVIIGIELHHANLALGERRGGNRKGADEQNRQDVADLPQKLTFPEWLKQHCPDVALRSAERYMALAKAAKAHLLKNGEEAIRALLAKPAAELNEEERETLHDTIHKVTDGKTYEQLALDFGLKGGKGKKNGKGTGNNGAETKRENNEPPVGWCRDEWDLYQAADDQEKTSIDLWRPIETGIITELENETLAHLPEQFLAHLELAATGLVSKISALRTAQQKKKGARK